MATFGDDVWKFQEYTLASGTPAADLIVVMSRAVYVVTDCSELFGVRVAVSVALL